MQHGLKLPRVFYTRNTHIVARALLGKLLVRTWHGKTFAVRITEVESYVGEDDAACHASRGKTKRNAVMFGEAGHAYVYFIYGMYHCLNVVTEEKDFPAAVLIRGGVLTAPSVPLESGTPPLGKGRKTAQKLDGPGKLCRALHITRVQNGEDLVTSEKLLIADDGYRVRKKDIVTTPRIGVAYAGEDALLPWRYFLDVSPLLRQLAD